METKLNNDKSKEQLREELAAAYIRLSGKDSHRQDCATSIAPAYDPGPCNCTTK